LYPRMESFLQQGFREQAPFEPSIAMLNQLFE
jgi:flagellum-specific ATP synthase